MISGFIHVWIVGFLLILAMMTLRNDITKDNDWTRALVRGIHKRLERIEQELGLDVYKLELEQEAS